MSNKKTTPAMEGSVQRAVDFNLKKEDLMLLILEGRKEIMEENISALQTKSTRLKHDLAEANAAIEKKVRKLVLKSMNAEAKKLAQGFSKKAATGDEIDYEQIFMVRLDDTLHRVEYTNFRSKPIGDSKTGSTYIKVQEESCVYIKLFGRVKISFDMMLHGKIFANPNEIFGKRDAVRPCGEYSHTFTILDDVLSIDFQKTLPEFNKAREVAEEFAANESLLSDVLAEYDLFNRNQPRAKAKMIKEVLARDEAGQALLGNILTAATGVKLLAPAK